MKLSSSVIAPFATLALSAGPSADLTSALPLAPQVKPKGSWVDTWPARGVQITACRDKGDRPDLHFIAPDADVPLAGGTA